jgi:hypothetical protein
MSAYAIEWAQSTLLRARTDMQLNGVPKLSPLVHITRVFPAIDSYYK